MRRCENIGKDALIVKAADTLDSFKWYKKQNNKDELRYCADNTDALFQILSSGVGGKVFDDLREQRNKKTE